MGYQIKLTHPRSLEGRFVEFFFSLDRIRGGIGQTPVFGAKLDDLVFTSTDFSALQEEIRETFAQLEDAKLSMRRYLVIDLSYSVTEPDHINFQLKIDAFVADVSDEIIVSDRTDPVRIYHYLVKEGGEWIPFGRAGELMIGAGHGVRLVPFSEERHLAILRAVEQISLCSQALAAAIWGRTNLDASALDALLASPWLSTNRRAMQDALRSASIEFQPDLLLDEGALMDGQDDHDLPDEELDQWITLGTPRDARAVHRAMRELKRRRAADRELSNWRRRLELMVVDEAPLELSMLVPDLIAVLHKITGGRTDDDATRRESEL